MRVGVGVHTHYTTLKQYTTHVYVCRYIHTVHVSLLYRKRKVLLQLQRRNLLLKPHLSYKCCRCIIDLCRGDGGGRTRCATNRRICGVVTYRQLLRPNEVLGRPCHDARDHLSLLVARFSRSVQVSSWFVAQQNLSTIAARAYHYIERVGGLC